MRVTHHKHHGIAPRWYRLCKAGDRVVPSEWPVLSEAASFLGCIGRAERHTAFNVV